jgi:hypothetical protein
LVAGYFPWVYALLVAVMMALGAVAVAGLIASLFIKKNRRD